jgi:suppressor of fused protein SUFU
VVERDEQELADSVRAALSAYFGHQPDSASVSFVGVEPISVLRFHEADLVVYVTAGMSSRPLPATADGLDVVALAGDGPRGELMLRVRARGLGADEVWRRLAVLGAAPVVEGLRYAEGAVIAVGEPLVAGSRTRGVVVVDSGVDLHGVASAVTVFEVLPATADELAWARVHGVAALRARWLEQGVDLTDLGRLQARLT